VSDNADGRDLRSLLERRNQEFDGLGQSAATSQGEMTRLQLHFNEMTMSLAHLDRSWKNPEQSRLQPERLRKLVDSNWHA